MIDVTLKIASEEDGFDSAALVNMINQVYRASEDSIWKAEHLRISLARLNEIIQAGELIVAIYKQEVVGCIHLEPVSQNLFKFKMVAVSPAYKRNNIGNKLVRFAEKTACSHGAKTMQLELLVPTGFVHPDKVVLHNWYTKIGYQKGKAYSVDYCHDGISQFLKVDCKAIVYQKPLT